MTWFPLLSLRRLSPFSQPLHTKQAHCSRWTRILSILANTESFHFMNPMVFHLSYSLQYMHIYLWSMVYGLNFPWVAGDSNPGCVWVQFLILNSTFPQQEFRAPTVYSRKSICHQFHLFSPDELWESQPANVHLTWKGSKHMVQICECDF